jgi:hypothetical protein
MEIYNYHTDLLVSLRYFFDNFIFNSGVIKGYQFNIGDRSLQINNDPKFELPRIIINYGSNHSLFYHPYTWLRTQLNNSAVPILYNRTKNLTLEVHEELFEFQIAVIINCESQLSALNIEHALQNKLILNKYFSLYEYNSFIEIDKQFLTSQMFDVNNDDILNLFIKYNPIRNLTEYCYSIKYSPMIKMDSIDIQLGSTDQHSFSISVALTILNHVPVYHDIPSYEKRITPVKISIHKNIIIPNNLPLIAIELTDINNNTNKVSTICDYDPLTGDFNNPFIINTDSVSKDIISDSSYVQSGMISGNVKSIEYSGVYTTIIDSKPIKSNCILTYAIINKSYTAILSGALTGVIPNIFLKDVTEFDGIFISSNVQRFKVSGTFKIEQTHYILNNSKVSFINSSIPIVKSNVSSVPLGKLYHCFKDTDPRFALITKTIFKKAIFKYQDNIIDYNITDYTLYETGDFLITIILNDNLSGIINGRIDYKTLEITYSTYLDIQILSLVCDFELKSVSNYGSLYIDRINITINSTYDPVIIDSTYFSFYNEASKPNVTRSLYRTVILLFSNFDRIFKFEEDSVIITIELDPLFIYNSNLYWSFYNKIQIYDSLSSDIYLLERTDIDLPNVLKFKCSKDIYESYFSYLDIDNPIIFQVFREV